MKDRSLFKLFGLLRSAPHRDPKAAAAGRQRYMSQVDRFKAQSKRPASTWSIFGQKNFAMAVMASLLVLVFLVTSGAGVVAAAQGTLPGDALYPVKTFSEDVRLVLTTNAQSKFDLLASYVMNRINEIDTLQESGGILPVNITGRIGSQLDAMLAVVASMDDASMTTALVDMQKMLMGQYMKLVSGTTGDHDRLQDNFQIMLHVMILKQNRDYLDLTTLGLTDPAGLRYMYAGINKPVDTGNANSGSGNGTGSGSANTDPGNVDAGGPGPGEGSENSFGPGYITTVVTDTEGITSTVTLPGTWGPGAAGGIVLTDVLTTTHYGVGPDEPLYYWWGEGLEGSTGEDGTMYKQMQKHAP